MNEDGEIQGLRTAKRLTRRQVNVIKGERGEWARGYRRAINDLVAVIGAEIDGQMAEQTTERIRRDLLEPTRTIDELLAEIAEGAPRLRELSDAEFLQLSDAYFRNIDEIAKARVKTDEELLAETLLPRSLSDKFKRDILDRRRDEAFRTAKMQVMQETGAWGQDGPKRPETIDEVLAEMARTAEMAAEVRQKLQEKSQEPQPAKTIDEAQKLEETVRNWLQTPVDVLVKSQIKTDDELLADLDLSAPMPDGVRHEILKMSDEEVERVLSDMRRAR